MANLISQFKKVLENKDAKFVMATIIESSGSVPQRKGASMVVYHDGENYHTFGTIGGGMLEFRCIEACKKLMETQDTLVFDFDMNDDYSRDAGPICGGSLKIFLNGRIGSQAEQIAGIVNYGAKHDSFFVGVKTNDDTGDAGTILFSVEKPGEAESNVFWQEVSTGRKLYVVGAGHCGLAIAELGHWLGFETHLIDERTLNSDYAFSRFVGRFSDFLHSHQIDRSTAIVLVNKGHKDDAEDLEACVHSGAGYIGMIGSRRKATLLKNHFIEEKITTPEDWARIYSPIGLDISAVEVKEIALSIITEIVAVFNGRHPDKTPLKCMKL